MRLPFFALALLACNSSPPAPTDAGADLVPPGPALVRFDLSADTSQQAHFFDFPWPSDLHLTSDGKPIVSGFPNPSALKLVEGLRNIAGDRPGFPVLPVAYFQFSAPLAAADPENTIAAAPTSPLLLVDTDEKSPERGRLIPLVANTPPVDDYVPANVLALAPRPGFVLTAGRRYAFVVRRALKDAVGQPLAVPDAITTMIGGGAPAGANGAAAQALYAPLWTTLKMINVDPSEVAAATVFTTGDVVAATSALSTALVAKYHVTIDNLVYTPEAGVTQDRFCELVGSVSFPQFQKGVPPFNSQGLFDFSDSGLPAKQRDETAPIVITIPKQPMPAGGYPLEVFFHGSGGVFTAVVDRGPVTMAGGNDTPGRGPAYVVAEHGIAAAGSALPLNPDRLVNAPELAYINFNNLAAFRDTFRQGVIEQRLYIEALRTLTIDPATLGACTGPSLPAGETAYHFNPAQLIAQGQSMGGMYTNMISASEPRVKIAVPTGAGGFWSYMVLKTSLIPNAGPLLAGILGTDTLTFLHPTMQLLELAWEPSDPMVYIPRVARRPLPGHPARPIYECVGYNDEYFPTVVYDAIALAYGHNEAGDVIWPTMQMALALDKLDGVLPYPVANNRTSATGDKYTGAVIQYKGDGLDDPHAIYKQLDAVKFQYGCFLASWLKTGTATIPSVKPLGSPCD